jgi:hypothetical protein
VRHAQLEARYLVQMCVCRTLGRIIAGSRGYASPPGGRRMRTGITWLSVHRARNDPGRSTAPRSASSGRETVSACPPSRRTPRRRCRSKVTGVHRTRSLKLTAPRPSDRR